MMIDVVAGLILNDQGQLLACLRPEGKHLAGKWEFPGGKVESGESPEDALTRELHEELEVVVTIGRPLTPVTHDYGRGPIQLMPFICRITRGFPRPHEHSELKWCAASELKELDWAAADLPILDEFLSIQTQ